MIFAKMNNSGMISGQECCLFKTLKCWVAELQTFDISIQFEHYGHNKNDLYRCLFKIKCFFNYIFINQQDIS